MCMCRDRFLFGSLPYRFIINKDNLIRSTEHIVTPFYLDQTKNGQVGMEKSSSQIKRAKNTHIFFTLACHLVRIDCLPSPENTQKMSYLSKFTTQSKKMLQ